MNVINGIKTAEDWRKALMGIGYYAPDEVAEQMANWSKTMSPLVVSGPEFGGKSLLVESIIALLNKENDFSNHNTCHVQFTFRYPFEELFYKWNGRMRELFRGIAEKDAAQYNRYEVDTSSQFADEGILVNFLKSEKPLSYLIVDFYDANFSDEKTDQYLARFIKNKEIYIEESDELLSLPEGKNILVFVIRHSYEKGQDPEKSATSRVLAEEAFHLTIPEATIAYKMETLREIYPQLSDGMIRDLSVFTDEFNKLPDLQKKVSFGEFLCAAELLTQSKGAELTANGLVEHAGWLVKNQHDYENFPANAARVLETIKSAQYST